MDREIPLKDRRIAALKRWSRVVVILLAIAALTFVGIRLWGDSVRESSLEFSAVERGDLQVTISASGSIVPEYQEILVSPLSTRIVEVYKRAGDIVEAGTPLLRLDLQSAETDYQKGLDDEKVKQVELGKLGIEQNTQLTDLEMRIKVAEMSLNSKHMELRNERYLDSIGSGTHDRVRQAELEYKTAQLELSQLRKQLANAKRTASAARSVQQLGIDMHRKGLELTRRTLEDAKIRSPRHAVLTYINSSIGAQVAQGEQVATVSDLSSFKCEVTVADGYADRIAAGGRVLVRTSGKQLGGTITAVNPQTKNGMIDFTIRLDEPSNRLLRSGLKVEVYVISSEKQDILRIRSGSFYQGASTYRLFVREGATLEARDVELGEANYDYIEVKSGLREGEQVVVSNMEKYKGKNKIRIK